MWVLNYDFLKVAILGCWPVNPSIFRSSLIENFFHLKAFPSLYCSFSLHSFCGSMPIIPATHDPKQLSAWAEVACSRSPRQSPQNSGLRASSFCLRDLPCCAFGPMIEHRPRSQFPSIRRRNLLDFLQSASLSAMQPFGRWVTRALALDRSKWSSQMVPSQLWNWAEMHLIALKTGHKNPHFISAIGLPAIINHCQNSTILNYSRQ